MLANVTCPACHHKFWLDESQMGSRQICPSCNSPFFAGKSMAEARVGAPAGPAAQAGYAKTMLTDDSAPPIKYNCPRCKAALEAASSEAGTKKNCPQCTQRHQVPAQLKLEPSAAGPNLNKTMLAGDESAAPKPPIKYNCPNCKKPLEAPAEQAGMKNNCPSCGQRLQIPAAPAGAPSLNKTRLATDAGAGTASPAAYSADGGRGSVPAAAGAAPAAVAWPQYVTPRNVALAVGALLALWIVISLLRPPTPIVDKKAEADLQVALEKVRGEFELKKQERDQEFKRQQAELDRRETEKRRYEEQKDRDDRDHREALLRIEDENQKKKFDREYKLAQQKKEDADREKERQHQEEMERAKDRLAAKQRELDAANQRQQTIITAPQPVYYPPWYSPHRYWWW
jgi:DNA-directed RNA polymerase subunit RPC12/RpoP/Skp family chaperone for outer membrane proteins